MTAARVCLALVAVAVTLGACIVTLYLGDAPRFLVVLFAGSCAAAEGEVVRLRDEVQRLKAPASGEPISWDRC